MSGTKEYIEEYGNISFNDRPFCDADAVALCEVFYMPFEKVVSTSFNDEPKNFAVACNELFALKNYKHKGLGLMITAAPSKRMMKMANKVRFSQMKIVAVQEVYSSSPAIQYCAGTFILPDSTVVVVFRGTDDSVAGWIEDLEMILRKNSKAYSLALDYVENVSKHFGSNIIICGHSKGGHIGLYAAVKCSQEARDRIVGIYNNDGPGYHDYGLFHLNSYSEILPVYNHLLPSASLVGMIMCHDDDYKVVKSSRYLGALQHDLGTWKIENGSLVYLDDLDFIGKLTDFWMSKVTSGITDEHSAAIALVITAIAAGFGEETLTLVLKNAKKSISGAYKSYKEIDFITKEIFKEALKGGGKLLVETAKFAKNQFSANKKNAS